MEFDPYTPVTEQSLMDRAEQALALIEALCDLILAELADLRDGLQRGEEP